MQIVIDIPEEVYKSIQDNDYCGISNADMYNAVKNGTPLDMAIKALEQEPCEDAISRQAVFDALESIGSLDTEADKKYARSVFEALQPVTPQPKTGHWIRMKAYEKWGCSECSTVFRFTFKEHNYCPNCGAKMQEVEE